jgi:hypothetical protein
MKRDARLSRRTGVLILAGLMVAIAGVFLVLMPKPVPDPPLPGLGDPVLLITSSSDHYTEYYAEILRAEGLSGFRSVELRSLTRADLDGAAVALLASVPLDKQQLGLFADWVEAGGNLIAFRPSQQLAGVFGLRPHDGTLADRYLRVDTSQSPGAGITDATMQFHGPADLYDSLAGTRTVATLFSDANTPTEFPAVTTLEVGNRGGHAVAFTYDLARSIIRTRQGNPEWAGQDRDGLAPTRPNDLFEGVSGAPDYVDMSEVAIPQADEQQRMLANAITELAQDRSVLVRSWYLPKGAKAAVVLAADDHTPGDRARESLAFQNANSPADCSVADWECIRSTSLMYSSGSLTDAELAVYQGLGFDFGVHVTTDCKDWTSDSLRQAYATDLAAFRKRYPSLSEQVATRIHCVAWSDYASAATIASDFGIRLDLDYYYWPSRWVQNRPGFFTGSGIPMRFADTGGNLIDVYQAPTQLVNESGMDYPAAIDLQLDRALGSLGYYGAFGTHYDYSDSFDHELIASATKRGVPLVSARQLTQWLDARNASSFTPGTWTGSSLAFSADVDPAARQLLRGMVPARTGHGVLSTLTKDGSPATFTVDVIKGVEYAFFTATTGSYEASYTEDHLGPAVIATTPEQGALLQLVAPISISFSEPLNPATVDEQSVQLSDGDGNRVPCRITYLAGGLTIGVTPNERLHPGTTYRLALATRIADNVGNPLEAAHVFTYQTPDASASLWAPGQPDGVQTATQDRAKVELGLRFRTIADGTVTGITFYKGADQLARHTVTLWDAKGRALATARTSTEKTSGWQTARFDQPVTIRPGETYTASYLAPDGGYAFVNGPLAEDYTNGYLTALKNGDVYRYGGGYPDQDKSSSNYLVDVIFSPA